SSRGAIRIAINCFALPLAGRPTRRPRRNSWSVASGMSERSIRLSGIRLALFPRRLPRTDDANAFFPIFQPPWRVRDHQDSSRDGRSQALRPLLRLGMLGIIPVQRFRVAENGRGLFKRHAVLLQVAQSLSGIPGEHISVYTLIPASWEAILMW